MLAIVGYVIGNIPLAVCPLIVLAIFPGMPIAFHSIYFISVRISLQDGTLSVRDFAGDPFVSYPHTQTIELAQVVYVYHLGNEAEAHLGSATPPTPLRNTRLKLKKYRTANADPRRGGVVARTNNGLVLSDRDGEHKIYVMHFHDLSKNSWQELARELRKRNEAISFLMTEKEQKGFFGC